MNMTYEDKMPKVLRKCRINSRFFFNYMYKMQCGIE